MMKPSMEDKATGKLHEVKGAIKEKVGKLTGTAGLEDNGRVEKNTGKIQGWVSKVEKAVGE